MRPRLEDTLLEIAVTVSKRSTCSRRNNGAVIANSKGVVLSTGYNGSLSGQPHCDHECTCGADIELNIHLHNVYLNGEKLDEEEKRELEVMINSVPHDKDCPAHPENGCTLAVHAEANAIYFAARNGVSVEKATIYCTTEPCTKCAEAIVQSGISTVWYSQEYRSHAGVELLRHVGIDVFRKELSV